MVVQTLSAMAENNEDYLDALNDFHRKQCKEVSEELEKLLCHIAQTGEPLFPWSKLKPLVICKLENVIQDYLETNPDETMEILPNVENIEFRDMRDRLLQAVNAFTNAPFTIQRLCELLTEPRRYYQRSDKFMRGFEKNVQVVSTVTSGGKRITSFSHMQTSTSAAMVNGVMTDSNGNDHHDDDKSCNPNPSAPIPTHEELPSDAQEMDTDPSTEKTNLEPSEKKDQQQDMLEFKASENECSGDRKLEDGPENRDRIESVVSSVSEGETLDLSMKQDSSVPEMGSDNERTSGTKDEEALSSSIDSGVHRNEGRQVGEDAERQVTLKETKQVDEGSSIQDVSTTHENAADDPVSSSNSESGPALSSQSETTSVITKSENNAVEEPSQSQDTSNGTISDADNSSNSDISSDKSVSSETPKTCSEEQAAGGDQQEEPSAQRQKEVEGASESGEAEQQQNTKAAKSETSLDQSALEETPKTQGEEDTESSRQVQETLPVTDSGDAQSTAASENSAKSTSEENNDNFKSSSDPKDVTSQQSEEMEVDCALSSKHVKDDGPNASQEESSESTSADDKEVPSVEESESKKNETSSSTDEAMDHD